MSAMAGANHGSSPMDYFGLVRFARRIISLTTRITLLMAFVTTGLLYSPLVVGSSRNLVGLSIFLVPSRALAYKRVDDESI